MPLRLYAFLHPPVCKKCLSTTIQTIYCAETLCNGSVVDRDHLHRPCQTCGYAWLEECRRFAYRSISETNVTGERPSATLTRTKLSNC